MDNIEFRLEDVFHEIVNRMESEGAYEHEAYMTLIDEVLEERIGSGELDADANIKNYVESLQLMWPQAEALVSKTPDDGVSIGDENEEKLPDGFTVDKEP
jgi:hypothetical protein